MKRKYLLVDLLLITIIMFSFGSTIPETKSIEPYFTLVAKASTYDGYDVLSFVKQHLARIGIEVDVIISGWLNFPIELIAFRDFDLAYISLIGEINDPDFTGVYNENGSLNIFGYHTSMDYNETLGTGLNEWYMKYGRTMLPSNSSERVQHYWDWEQYLMDKILPMKPLFSANDYAYYWDELKGYNLSKGILQSWGNMYWNKSHLGQASTNELVICDDPWSDLNPIFIGSASSKFITEAIMDPLFWFDPNKSMWPHLAESFEVRNETYLRIKCREGVKWQNDPDGLFPNEYFDAKDLYFTLFAMKNFNTYSSYQRMNWIDSMKIIDKYTLDLFIDADPRTAEKEPFAPIFSELAIEILPEHYLNQTQTEDGITPDITDESWAKFSTHCFGTGLFKFHSFTEGSETVLKIWDDSWRMNSTLTEDPALNYENRFGDFSNDLSALRIIILDENYESVLLEGGLIDLMTTCQALSNSDIDMTNIKAQKIIKSSLSFIGFNMRPVRPVIGDTEPCERIDENISNGLAVRKAISYAIDREEINKIVYKSEYPFADYPIYSSLGIWCNPNIIKYDFNLEKAYYYMGISPKTSTVNVGLSIGVFNLIFIISCCYTYFKKKKNEN